jgi:SAM-dependent methyltransferase
MRASTRDVLLQLNRDFYRTVAAPFDATRMARSRGMERLLVYAPPAEHAHPLRVADVGCGNGRFAWMLEELARPVAYTGVDGNPQLLRAAAAHAAGLAWVTPRFLLADLAEPGWQRMLDEDAPFDMVVCLAPLQHMPGFDLRARLVADLASLLDEGGVLAVSAWQFMESERLRARVLGWSEAGLDPADVEPGDALLPWKQDVYAVRYVHQIDEAEMARLAASAGLVVTDAYRADGREGDLNLYALLRRGGSLREGKHVYRLVG